MEHGETPLETLKRELMEEINDPVVEATLLDVTLVNIKWQVRSDLNESDISPLAWHSLKILKFK